MRRPQVLALDLEGTLVSNAVSQIPRPNLFTFLTRCRELFPRIVVFTAVGELRFRAVARRLVEDEYAPHWFADLEFITWHGETKDLRFIPGATIEEILLVDDRVEYVHSGQESQWIEIYGYPYGDSLPDYGLLDVMQMLEARVSAHTERILENFPWDSMAESARAYYQATNHERHVIVKHGVPATYLNTLSRDIPIPKSRLCQLVGVNLSTINRKIRSGSRLRLADSDRVMFLAHLIGQIDSVAGKLADGGGHNSAWLIAWLNKPHDERNGRRPADYLDTGIGWRLISDLLQRGSAG